MNSAIKKIFSVIALVLLRYGLGIALIWLGIMKFKNIEAEYLQDLLANTTIFKWILKYFTAYAFSQMIAWIQIVAGVLLMIHPFAPKVSRWGAVLAMLIFLPGIIVFFSSDVVWLTGYGFPELSRTGQILLKDFILFGVAAGCFSEFK